MDQRKLFPIGITALPLGFVILGVISFGIYFMKADEAKSGGRENSENAALFRKDINQKDLERYVKTLSVDFGERHTGNYENLKKAAAWIDSTIGMTNMGYKVERQSFEVRGKKCENIEIEITGKTKPEEIVVVGAHYDTAGGTPGADDNGSGVAALICLANAFTGTEPERTLRFVAFTNEEPPHFQTSSMGSYVYAKRCKEREEDIVAMISLEAIGYYSDKRDSQKYPPILRARYPSTGNFLAVVGNVKSKSLVGQVAAELEEESELGIEKLSFLASVPGVGWSDHWSFWQFGYKAVMITDTAIYRNPHYHQATDLPETIDFKRLTEATIGIKAVIEDLVGGAGGGKGGIRGKKSTN